MKKYVWMTVAVASMAISAVVWAGPQERGGPDGDRGPRGPGGGKGAAIGWLVHNEAAARELGVTDDQLAQLKDQAYTTRQASIKLNAELDLARLGLSHLMESESVDEAAVDKAVDQISGIEAQLQKMQIKQQLKVRAILGSETLDKLQQQMRSRMREGRGEQRGQRDERRGGRGCDQRGRGQGMNCMDRMPRPDMPDAPPPAMDDEADD